MTKATITPKFVNPPRKPGAKYGSIKMEDGSTMAIPIAMLGKFTSGQAVLVDYEEQTWGDKDVKVVKDVRQAQPSTAKGGEAAAPWNVPNFVSNIVGQAIAAGRIESPDDLKRWALAAKRAGEAVLGIEEEDDEYGGPPDDYSTPGAGGAPF